MHDNSWVTICPKKKRLPKKQTNSNTMSQWLSSSYATGDRCIIDFPDLCQGSRRQPEKCASNRGLTPTKSHEPWGMPRRAKRRVCSFSSPDEGSDNQIALGVYSPCTFDIVHNSILVRPSTWQKFDPKKNRKRGAGVINEGRRKPIWSIEHRLLMRWKSGVKSREPYSLTQRWAASMIYVFLTKLLVVIQQY